MNLPLEVSMKGSLLSLLLALMLVAQLNSQATQSSPQPQTMAFVNIFDPEKKSQAPPQRYFWALVYRLKSRWSRKALDKARRETDGPINSPN